MGGDAIPAGDREGRPYGRVQGVWCNPALHFDL